MFLRLCTTTVFVTILVAAGAQASPLPSLELNDRSSLDPRASVLSARSGGHAGFWGSGDDDEGIDTSSATTCSSPIERLQIRLFPLGQPHPTAPVYSGVLKMLPAVQKPLLPPHRSWQIEYSLKPLRPACLLESCSGAPEAETWTKKHDISMRYVPMVPANHGSPILNYSLTIEQIKSPLVHSKSYLVNIPCIC